MYIWLYIHSHIVCSIDAYRVLSPETVTRQPRRLAVTVRRIRDEASEDGGLNIPSWFNVEKPSGVELDVEKPISKPGSKHKKELQNQGKYSKNWNGLDMVWYFIWNQRIGISHHKKRVSKPGFDMVWSCLIMFDPYDKKTQMFDRCWLSMAQA